MLSDGVPPYYTDGPIRKESRASEEFLRSHPYQPENLLKGTIWRRDPVTFSWCFASHVRALRFLGVNSNANRRKVHEQDDAQVDGNVFPGSVARWIGWNALRRL
jgi:hypothetical protein